MKSELERLDPKMHQLIKKEALRQNNALELIASENFAPQAVLEAQGSCLTNKYAEGYPLKRWYGGCQVVDEVEQLAIDRAKQLFKAEHVNVQPHSGTTANMAVYFSALEFGDTVLALDLACGGHLTHGHNHNFSGKFYSIINYGVDEKTFLFDYNKIAQLAKKFRPKMIVAGASAYPRIIDFKKFKDICDDVGALFFVDMAHISGLVAAGLHPSPVPFAHFVSSTTHKTLKGPRSGFVITKKEFARKLDTIIFPGIQGGPLMHVIAAKAVAFKLALSEQFRTYQKQTVLNARTLAASLQSEGIKIISGGTDTHLLLADVTSRGITGAFASQVLDEAGITVNKNLIPFDRLGPAVTSGIRLGTPALTSRGMKEDQMRIIGSLISLVLKENPAAKDIAFVKREVNKLTKQFPVYKKR